MKPFQACIPVVLEIFITFMIATTTTSAWSNSSQPWHAVLACQSISNVSPIRPGFRLKLPDFRFENGTFIVNNTYKEPTNNIVKEVWEGRIDKGNILVSARATRNDTDRWIYEFTPQSIEGESITLHGNMLNGDGAKIRQCTLNLTTLVSELTKTWNGLSEQAPIEYLIGNGQLWHYQTTNSSTPSKIQDREPDPSEKVFIQKVSRFFESSPAVAVAVVDGTNVIYSDTKFPVNRFSRLLSFSMGKSITSLAIGQVICANKLALETLVETVLPAFSGSPIGSSRVKDLLTMSSGTWQGFPDSTISTLVDDKRLRDGISGYHDLLLSSRVNSHAKTPSGSLLQPGSVFAYHSTDPLVLGLLINKLTGQTYAKYVESKILLPAGIKYSGIIGQDHFGHGAADGNIRLRFEDWIRLAIWIGTTRQESSCFADYVKQATSTQIINVSQAIGPNFGGYGYLFWTNNFHAPNTYWATGHGGQAIGWNSVNNKIMILFSTSDAQLTSFYRLYNEWINIK